MPLGYLIFGGLLCFGVVAVTVLGERPGALDRWVKRVFTVAGAACWLVALSIIILRIE